MPLNYNPEQGAVVAPEDDYFVLVEDAEEKISKNGNEMLVIDLSILSRRDDGDETHKGKTARHYLIYNSEWAQKTATRMFASALMTPTNVVNADTFKGRKMLVHLTIEEFDGEDQNKVTRFIKRDGVLDSEEPETGETDF